jgi:hypothetical protein
MPPSSSLLCGEIRILCNQILRIVYFFIGSILQNEPNLACLISHGSKGFDELNHSTTLIKDGQRTLHRAGVVRHMGGFA